MYTRIIVKLKMIEVYQAIWKKNRKKYKTSIFCNGCHLWRNGWLKQFKQIKQKTPSVLMREEVKLIAMMSFSWTLTKVCEAFLVTKCWLDPVLIIHNNQSLSSFIRYICVKSHNKVSRDIAKLRTSALSQLDLSLFGLIQRLFTTSTVYSGGLRE